MHDDGWIDWNGGVDCPVKEGENVAIEFRDGEVLPTVNCLPFDWRHHGCSSDIVRYRIIGQSRPIRDAVKEVGNNPKDDLGDKKVPLWLCSPQAKAMWAIAQACGRIKYGAWNWRHAGIRMSVYLSAAQRHLDAFMSGERCDPVDGTHHMGNLMACAAIIIDAEFAGKIIDDRPPSVEVRTAYAECERVLANLREKYKDVHPRHYTIADTEEFIVEEDEEDDEWLGRQ